MITSYIYPLGNRHTPFALEQDSAGAIYLRSTHDLGIQNRRPNDTLKTGWSLAMPEGLIGLIELEPWVKQAGVYLLNPYIQPGSSLHIVLQMALAMGYPPVNIKTGARVARVHPLSIGGSRMIKLVNEKET